MPRVGKTIKPKLDIRSGEGYCRKCKKTKTLTQFYETTNPMLDSNGFLSVCRDCCSEIYDLYFSIHNNFETALKLTCQDLDVRFSKDALKQTQSHIESLLTKGKLAEKVFGYYKSKLGSLSRSNEGIDSFRYKDSDISKPDNIKEFIDIDEGGEGITDENSVLFWGKGFNYEDYLFLEFELSNWKKTHQCDNQAELTLLKEICIKILKIRNKREINDDVSKDLKDLQDLMKTASVDPAKANVASSGKSAEVFGRWIKDIEQFKPAEWFEQQKKYKDMDGFVPYIKNYIVRPIQNFITGNRNFLVDDNIDADLDSVDVGNNYGNNNG